MKTKKEKEEKEAIDFKQQGLKPAWCPGCGNFLILKALQQALA